MQLSHVLHGQNKVLELHEQLLVCRHGAATDGEFDLAVPSHVRSCDLKAAARMRSCIRISQQLRVFFRVLP